MKRLLMFMVFVMIMTATSAQAVQGKPYFAGTFGYGILTDVDVGGLEISFDPGWGVMGAIGYDMGEIRVEGEFGYHTYDVDDVTIGGTPSSADGDVSALSFMANGYYDHDMGSPLTSYVGGGLGIVDLDFSVGGNSVSSGTEIAYQFMAGLGYEISRSTTLTAGYRFFGFTDNEGAFVHELNLGVRFML